jgi:heat shock protein HtpX
MMRIALFLLTNLAVMLVAGVVLSLLGVNSTLKANGVDLDLTSLLIMCGVYGFIGSFISLFISKWMAKRATGAQIIEQPRNQTEEWLLRTVKELSDKAGIGMPEVAVFPSHQSNAFATGWNRNASLVAISEGMLQRFDQEEIRAVLAHEIGHVANGDMVTLTLLQGVVNTFVLFFSRVIGHVVDRVVFKTERGYGPGFYIVSFLSQIVLGILASTIVMWFSRRREYRADEAGAKFASTAGMIGALQRLQAEQDMPDEMPDSLTAFGISGHKVSALFASHPPLADRIAALQNRNK